METAEEWIVTAISKVFEAQGCFLHAHLNQDAYKRGTRIGLYTKTKIGWMQACFSDIIICGRANNSDVLIHSLEINLL